MERNMKTTKKKSMYTLYVEGKITTDAYWEYLRENRKPVNNNRTDYATNGKAICHLSKEYWN